MPQSADFYLLKVWRDGTPESEAKVVPRVFDSIEDVETYIKGPDAIPGNYEAQGIKGPPNVPREAARAQLEKIIQPSNVPVH